MLKIIPCFCHQHAFQREHTRSSRVRCRGFRWGRTYSSCSLQRFPTTKAGSLHKWRNAVNRLFRAHLNGKNCKGIRQLPSPRVTGELPACSPEVSALRCLQRLRARVGYPQLPDLTASRDHQPRLTPELCSKPPGRQHVLWRASAEREVKRV